MPGIEASVSRKPYRCFVNNIILPNSLHYFLHTIIKSTIGTFYQLLIIFNLFTVPLFANYNAENCLFVLILLYIIYSVSNQRYLSTMTYHACVNIKFELSFAFTCVIIAIQ